jgi:hypothetical protein
MTFYGDMANVTTELLTEFGTDVIISKITRQKVIDTETGEVIIPEIRQEYTVKGIIKKYPENVIDGSRITVSDRQLMLETSGIEPVMTDKITINGQHWPIMEIESINPAGTALLYIVRVRR